MDVTFTIELITIYEALAGAFAYLFVGTLLALVAQSTCDKNERMGFGGCFAVILFWPIAAVAFLVWAMSPAIFW